MVETGTPFWGAVAAAAVAAVAGAIGAMAVAAGGVGAAAKACFVQVAMATKHKPMSTANAVARTR